MTHLNPIKNTFTFVWMCLLLANWAGARELSDQRKMLHSTSSDIEYRIALSAITKVNAVNSIEREIQIRSNVVSSTYEFDRDLSVNRAWAMLDAALVGERRLLFACDGLSCGSSSSWANDMFSIKQLYGLDQSQKYRVFAMQNQANTYKVVYFVQRGNKKIYAQVDTIVSLEAGRTIAPSKSAIASELASRGYYSIPVQPAAKGQPNGVAFDADELSAMIATLRAKPLTRYYLVGHSYINADLQEDTAQSQAYATALLKALTDARLSDRRFETHAIGHLAPESALPKERVNLVLKPSSSR